MKEDIELTIFRNVANGVNSHGSFLRAFGEALIRADAGNYMLLKPVATILIDNYNLDVEAGLSLNK